ncbi:MAG: thiolase family protein [Planctomycetaceae bacterium]|nr:thiolase family protein [Planctomycetaceae bacterium]
MTRQSSKKIVIVGAKRTPFGRFRGGLSQLTPAELGAAAAQSAMKAVPPELIDQVNVGNVLSAGHGMNVARQIALKCGLPQSVPAFTVNMMCGSGMQSAVLAAQAIHSGAASVVLAGGVESMTRSALLVSRPGRGQEPDVSQLADSMLTDGLRDSFNGEHMGITAERLATEFQISRDHQDAWAVRSQTLYQQALAAGHFGDEIEPVTTVLNDEHPRAGLSRSDLAALNPVFDAAGTVTAGNSSGINDGAAMLVMADAEVAKQHGWNVLCEWVHGTSIGCDPARMGLGPVHAIRKLVAEAGVETGAIDTLEINEAFAAQTLACFTELGLGWQDAANAESMKWQGRSVKVNAHGGAIAIGHPLAASGARLVCHLAWQIANGHSQNAIAALCIGGGMGIAAYLRQPL